LRQHFIGAHLEWLLVGCTARVSAPGGEVVQQVGLVGRPRCKAGQLLVGFGVGTERHAIKQRALARVAVVALVGIRNEQLLRRTRKCHIGQTYFFFTLIVG